jgi:hypothetical protein
MGRISRVLAVSGITGLLAIGGAGVAQASIDRGVQSNDNSAQVSRHDKNSVDRGSRDRNSSHDTSRR